MFRNLLLGTCVAFGLSACEVPVMIAAEKNQGQMTGMFEITFPAMMLIQLDDGTEELLSGQLIGHASGSAKYDLTGPNWGRCTGGYTTDGQNTMSCENGYAYAENVGKQKAKMSGVNVSSGSTAEGAFVAAFGWGNDANEPAVRQAISEYRTALN